MLRVRSSDVRGEAMRGEVMAGGDRARCSSGVSWYGAKLAIFGLFVEGAVAG